MKMKLRKLNPGDRFKCYGEDDCIFIRLKNDEFAQIACTNSEKFGFLIADLEVEVTACSIPILDLGGFCPKAI